jgi:lactate dehydrogenase-like 2-hydroxyacid dehydrogenase
VTTFKVVIVDPPSADHELLAWSDFVAVHCPLNASAHHLLGQRELRLMKPTAVLINTARGPIVDEAAMW